jgi:AcrR family transcriptional regulator
MQMETRPSNSPAQFREAGRRQARKQATRTAVLEAAQRLFALNGYENTTVRAIADAAGITERTLYRYFDGKEGLLAEEAITWTEKLCDAISTRPPGEAPYPAVQRAMITVAGELNGDSGDGSLARLIEFPRPIELVRRSSPRPLRQLETAITDAVRARRGGPEPQFDDQILGRLAVAVLRSAAIRHRELLATTGASPGLVSLLTDSFAAVARLTSSTSGAGNGH